MAGLDKIIENIKIEADAKTEEILSAAKEAADALVNEAQADASKILADAEAKAKRDAEQVVERAHSSAQLKQQKMVLEKKQELIEDVLTKAKTSLEELPEADYFALIEKMASRFHIDEAGTVYFSKKDLARLPEGFADKVGKAIGDQVTVSQEPANIDGGFILSYGGIEENYSFDAMFRSERGRLQDVISGILFEDEASK